MPKKNLKKELLPLKYIEEARPFYLRTLLKILEECEQVVNSKLDKILGQREQDKVVGLLLVLQMVNDKTLLLDNFDITKRVFNLIFNGYKALDRKIQVGCLDMFLTSALIIDPKTSYDHKLDASHIKLISDKTQVDI